MRLLLPQPIPHLLCSKLPRIIILQSVSVWNSSLFSSLAFTPYLTCRYILIWTEYYLFTQWVEKSEKNQCGESKRDLWEVCCTSSARRRRPPKFIAGPGRSVKTLNHFVLTLPISCTLIFDLMNFILYLGSLFICLLLSFNIRCLEGKDCIYKSCVSSEWFLVSVWNQQFIE